VVRAEKYREEGMCPPFLHLVHAAVLDLQLAVLTEEKVLQITGISCNTALAPIQGSSSTSISASAKDIVDAKSEYCCILSAIGMRCCML
jgi:hypothetical protein